MKWDSLEYDKEVQRFLDKSRLCIFSKRVENVCPPWIKYLSEMYEPGSKSACPSCGCLHGDRHEVSIIRLDTEEMCEFEFWNTPVLLNEPPPETFIFAAVQDWMFYPKDYDELAAKLPKAEEKDVRYLLNLSWQIFNFFTEDEREALRRN
jgi:hypothetical protein